MSRAFHPPESLSKEHIKTIADVRRKIWTNGFYGLCYGTIAGYSLHKIAEVGNNRGFWKTGKLNKNTALFSVLAAGALGSFVMALTTGKNEVHNLHPIFALGVRPSAVEESVRQARARDDGLRYLEKRAQVHLSADEQDMLERMKRENNRLYRRASLTQSLEHGGLSDSHGGHWIRDEDEEEEH